MVKPASNKNHSSKSGDASRVEQEASVETTGGAYKLRDTSTEFAYLALDPTHVTRGDPGGAVCHFLVVTNEPAVLQRQR